MCYMNAFPILLHLIQEGLHKCASFWNILGESLNLIVFFNGLETDTFYK